MKNGRKWKGLMKRRRVKVKYTQEHGGEHTGSGVQKDRAFSPFSLLSCVTAVGAGILAAVGIVPSILTAGSVPENYAVLGLLRILAAVTDLDVLSPAPAPIPPGPTTAPKTIPVRNIAGRVGVAPAPIVDRSERKTAPPPSGKAVFNPGTQIVALASSTGGPKALQSVIPKLPANLKVPVVVVQHMPAGFTASLSERLNSLSEVTVKEAAEGDVLMPGSVYIAMGGKHLNILNVAGKYTIHYSDEPAREGVKPCANYMYESLMDSKLDRIVCVVMTGMGADGTEGIQHLKEKKKIHVIVQEASTCAVYGMPKSAVNAGLADQIVPLEQIAQEITTNVGVK